MPNVSVVELSELNGTNGFRIGGQSRYDNSGRSVSSAGDVNGDGFDDIIVGAPGAGQNSSGLSYVVFGKAGGFHADIDVAELRGATGFRITGEGSFDYSGYSVSSAGDVNGDGFSDVIIGATGAEPNGLFSGASYVVFGKAGGSAPNINLSSLNGTSGFQISGETQRSYSGASVSSAGDVNSDGFDDLIIGTLRGNASYVVFGKASGFGTEFEVSDLDGTNGFQISGETPYDNSGRSVSSAGDVNGDGFDDIVIGAPCSPLNGTCSGASYVVFGKSGGFAADLDLSALDGADGFQISGETEVDYSGMSVSSAGDVNGDGIDDIAIGAPGADAGYVVFGRDDGFAAEIELSSLNGADGFRIASASSSDDRGRSVSSAGDVNGDGIDDIIVGAPDAASRPGNYSGEIHVIFGQASPFAATVDVSRLNGVRGFTIRGEETNDDAGISVSAAGDVNGDGFDDLIIGAHRANSGGPDSGAGYVVFGKPTQAVTHIGTSADEALTGSEFRDLLDGRNGDDTLAGNGGNDTLLGGFGDDLLDGGSGADQLKGQAGDDTYIVDAAREAIETSGGGVDTVLSALSHTLGAHIENLTLTGAGDHDGTGNGLANVIIGANVLDGGAGRDTLRGGRGDDTYIADAAGEAFEAPQQGLDTVLSTASYVLGDHIENLTLLGAAARGTGNLLVNTLTGNDGNNVLEGLHGNDFLFGAGGDDRLDGGVGSDRMEGGLGDDTYVLDESTDRVTEQQGEGADLVLSALGHTLSANIENLTLTDTAIRGTGNTLGNALTGNRIGNTLDGGRGDDTLVGGAGNDLLVGGLGRDFMQGDTGADTFDFNAAAESAAGANRDVIAYVRGDDIDLAGIDAMTSRAGNQAFAWTDRADLDAAFTREAGQLRYAGGILQGDLNGDGRADFEIALRGAPVLAVADVIL